MSDTPRMIAARNAAMEHMTGDVWRVGCQLELELNAANKLLEEIEKSGVYEGRPIPDAGDPDATPIMDAVDVKCDELNVMDAICYAVYEGQKLEIQLNKANARIQHLEDIINRAHLAFFSDSSDRKVTIAMHRILDEEVRKESQ